MSLPFDAASSSAGVANPFADQEPQESDDDEEADDSEGGGVLDTIGGALGAGGNAFRSGVDTVVDSGPVPLQDYALYAIGTTTDTEDPASEEGRQQTAEDLSRGFEQIEQGTERFVSATSPVPTAIEATAGPDSGALDAYEGTVDFATDVAFGLPRDLATLATGVDTQTAERDSDVSPYLAIDAAGLRTGRLAARSAPDVADAAGSTDAAQTAAENSDTMASRILRGLSRASPISRGRNLLGRADDTTGARFLDDTTSSGARAGDEIDDTVDYTEDFSSFDDIGSEADDLPVLADDAARSANDALRGGNVPAVADDVADEGGSVFDSVTSGLRSAGSTVRGGIDDAINTVRQNPRRTAGVAGGGAAVAGSAYAYQNIDDDAVGGDDDGDSSGFFGLAGDDEDGGNGEEGGANPDSMFQFGEGVLDAEWSMSDMGPDESQTIEVRVTNLTNRPATVSVYLTAEIDGEEYVVDESGSQRLGMSRSAGTYSGGYVDSGPNASTAYQLNLSSPGANGITGRTRFNLYAEGEFETTDEAVIELGSETIVIAEGRENADGNSGWSEAGVVYTLQYGWVLFAQRNTEGERRYMVAGNMEDGSTRYLNESGAVVDAPDFFESEDEALAAHEAWVERASEGRTATDETTIPAGGRPDSQRVTEDAGGAGGGGGGTLSTVTRAMGVSGDEWDAGRLARLGLSVGILLYVLNRYGYIDIGSWPVVGEVV
jgi:hypothetical protein